MKIGVPKTIFCPNSQNHFVLRAIGLDGKDTTHTFEDLTTKHTLELNASRIETYYEYDREQPKDLIPQGKYECAAAALSTLTGHTLFQVKRVMGSHGWRNDKSGASHRILKLTVRDFGRDLIPIGRMGMLALLDDIPDCMVTVPSLNYLNSFHGVSWYNGQIVDPNYGKAGRKCYGPIWAPWTIGACGAEIITKSNLSSDFMQELRQVAKNKDIKTYRKMILEAA